jgi:putative transposase
MPNYRRFHRPGATWFFTVVSHRRQQLFCQSQVRKSLRASIQKCRIRHPFEILAWVLLPDHMHCIWQLPERDSNYSQRWKLIKQRVTRDLRTSPLAAPSLEGAVWQKRFWEHCIRDDKDFERHLDYVHFNPVKHGYSLAPSGWPYSTFHRYQREGIYSVDWACDPEQVKLTGTHEFGERETGRRT